MATSGQNPTASSGASGGASTQILPAFCPREYQVCLLIRVFSNPFSIFYLFMEVNLSLINPSFEQEWCSASTMCT